MSKDIKSPKSIIDQIYDEMFNLLKEDDNFDENFIQKLRNLAIKGDLQKEKKIAANTFFVKVGQRPFGLTFDFEGWQVVLYANARSYGWKAKRNKKP